MNFHSYFFPVGSSAGLLMTSQTSINESVFGEFGLSHSLNKSSAASNVLYRKRHKSFGDHAKRRRAFSLQEDSLNGEEKQRHQSHDGTYEEESGDSQLTPRVDISGKIPSLSEKTCNGAGDNESGDATSQPVNGVNTLNGPLINGDMNGDCEGRTSGLHDAIPPDIDMSDGLGMGNGNLSSDTLKSEKLLDLDCSYRSINDSDTTVFSDIQNDGQPKTSRNSSKPNSPAHVVRTPVTENDPLGLFMSPALQQSTPATAADTITTPSNGPRKMLFSVDSEANDSGVSSTIAQSFGNRSNLLIDLEPFSSPNKKSPAALFTIGNSPERDSEKAGGDASEKPAKSISSSDASSPGSPEAWAPLSQSQSQSQLQNATPEAPDVISTEQLRKASTLPSNMDKKGELKHSVSVDKATPPSGKRGKPVSRAESFGFGSALKSAAHLFSTKFSELKQTMVTPTKGEGGGSQASLPKPHEMEKVLYEQEEDMFLRKAGSLDHLGRSGVLTSGDDKADGASLDGHLDAAPKIRQQKGYTPFGESFNINTYFNTYSMLTSKCYLRSLRYLDIVSFSLDIISLGP